MTACPDLRLLGLVEKQIPTGSQVILKKSVADLSIVSQAISNSLVAVAEKRKRLGLIATAHFTKMLFAVCSAISQIFKLKLSAC